MFSGGFRGQKLKTSLRLSINRLKLMEKKKTEMAQKARKEIADFIQMNKFDRARIRVEHIIREDYLVEAMELIEMYCDLLLARFGLIETMKHCDEGLAESVSTILWASPRLSTDCQELKGVSDQLTLKYGKEFVQQARSNTNNTVNERLILKLSPNPPPKVLVERYLIEIARNYNVPFEPDPDVMMSEGVPSINSKEFEALSNPDIGFSIGGNSSGNGSNFGPPPPPPAGGNSNNFGGSSGGGGGMVYPPPGANTTPYPPGDVPPYPRGDVPPYTNDPGMKPYPGVHSEPAPPYSGPGVPSQPGGASRPGGLQVNLPPPGVSSIPDLPDIPTGSLNVNPGVGGQSGGGDDVDFDDLTRRFEELKKKK